MIGSNVKNFVFLQRNETVYNLLQLSSRSLSKNEFVSNAEQILRVFEDEVIEKVEMNGYSGNATDKWDLSDSFLYSVTVSLDSRWYSVNFRNF